MPIVVGAVLPGIETDDSGSCRVVKMIEEEQLDASAVPRKNAEVHATTANGCSERGCAPLARFVGYIATFFRNRNHSRLFMTSVNTRLDFWKVKIIPFLQRSARNLLVKTKKPPRQTFSAPDGYLAYIFFVFRTITPNSPHSFPPAVPAPAA